jgi:hypothetical protein
MVVLGAQPRDQNQRGLVDGQPVNIVWSSMVWWIATTRQ